MQKHKSVNERTHAGPHDFVKISQSLISGHLTFSLQDKVSKMSCDVTKHLIYLVSEIFAKKITFYLQKWN